MTQLVLSGSKCVTSYNADTGKLLWIINGPTEQYVASLVFLDEMLFLTTGFPRTSPDGHRPRRRGRHHRHARPLAHRQRRQRRRRASYVPSPIACDDHFFVVSDLGYLSCLDAADRRTACGWKSSAGITARRRCWRTAISISRRRRRDVGAEGEPQVRGGGEERARRGVLCVAGRCRTANCSSARSTICTVSVLLSRQAEGRTSRDRQGAGRALPDGRGSYPGPPEGTNSNFPIAGWVSTFPAHASACSSRIRRISSTASGCWWTWKWSAGTISSDSASSRWALRYGTTPSPFSSPPPSSRSQTVRAGGAIPTTEW